MFLPEAEADLVKLYDYIESQAGRQIAQNYITRIETFCIGLDLASEPGTLRDDVRKGLRVVARQVLPERDDRVVVEGIILD